MWPDRVSNPETLALESDALPTALRSLASFYESISSKRIYIIQKSFKYLSLLMKC